jgi:hypothetical protein
MTKLTNKIVIDTQYMENYSDDPKTPYWKSKGGSIYTIYGNWDTSVEEWSKVEDVVREVSKLIEYSNPASEEYVIGSRVVDADKTVTEDWESECVIAKNFYGNYVLTRDTYLGSTESWVMLPEGDRENYINLKKTG